MHRIAVLNGPNLGELSSRETEHYGDLAYDELERYCIDYGRELGLDVHCRQTDGEGELVRLIHESAAACDGIVLNAAAYTHTSVAVRDALLCVSVPVVEVHLSNPAAREDFRRRNLIVDVVSGSVAGFGSRGYGLALSGLKELLA
ncbi:3-dehydroquinate dehydratase [bacterium]|nr:3-dehydroquinate dehydratase [bacterium]MBU1072172.1 3-dehydroquinate dehydratase [bacterium]